MFYLVDYFDYYILAKEDIVRFSVVRITLNVMSLLQNVQMMVFPSSNALKRCIIYGSFLVITLNINSIYQGNIITQLNSKPQFGEISTIEQLLDTKLNIYVNEHLLPFMEPYKNFDEGTVFRRMYERRETKVKKFEDQLKITSINRTAAFLTPEIYISTFMAESFENGVKRVEKVPETPMKYFSGLMIPKNSPYIKRFNEIIDLIVAAGIVNYQTDKAKREADLGYIGKIKKYGIEGNKLKLLGMKELKSLFHCYIILCCLAIVLFTFELFLKQQASKSRFLQKIEDFFESNRA